MVNKGRIAHQGNEGKQTRARSVLGGLTIMFGGVVRGISFLVAVVGAFLFIFGLIVSIHYYGQIKGTYNELATKFPYAIPICEHCKKTLPKDSSKSCIYC